jgi:HSP20 family protein
MRANCRKSTEARRRERELNLLSRKTETHPGLQPDGWRRPEVTALERKGEVPMLNMTRWTPWTELAGVHRDLDSIFNRVFGETNRYQGETSRYQNLDVFTPAADVRRDGETWNVCVALPGISPEDVNIEVVGRTLKLRAQRQVTAVEDKAEAVIREIPYGRFEREFTLPEDIDVKHVKASYRHGMLDLVLPIAEGAKPYRISVNDAVEPKQLQAA